MTEPLLFEQKGHLGIITLNRAPQLNALTLPMMKAFFNQLALWKEDASIHAVLIKAVSGKAFCAGGDIRWLYETGRSNPSENLDFFRHEYRLNYAIHHFGKPYIALMDGITMGGGVGVSLHGSHPIATERFVFAMPETTIGFFPDIGASFLLAKCPKPLGMYLGLTGNRLNAQEAMEASLVKGVIASTEFEAVLEDLIHMDLSEHAHEKLDAYFAVEKAAKETHHFLEKEIASCFSQDSLDAIVYALSRTDSENAQLLLQNLYQKSPMSLKVTFEQLSKAQNLSLAACLKMDFILVKHFMQSHDFYEGVRALLVDKDKSPRFEPSSIQSVTQEMVAGYFQPIGDELEINVL